MENNGFEGLRISLGGGGADARSGASLRGSGASGGGADARSGASLHGGTGGHGGTSLREAPGGAMPPTRVGAPHEEPAPGAAGVQEFRLGDAFFEAMHGEISRGDVRVRVSAGRESASRFLITVGIEGDVVGQCARCLDDVRVPVSERAQVVAVVGGGRETAEADVLLADERTGEVDLSWFVYETIALAMPLKMVHDEGHCNPRMMEILGRLAAGAAVGGRAQWPVPTDEAREETSDKRHKE